MISELSRPASAATQSSRRPVAGGGGAGVTRPASAATTMLGSGCLADPPPLPPRSLPSLSRSFLFRSPLYICFYLSCHLRRWPITRGMCDPRILAWRDPRHDPRILVSSYPRILSTLVSSRGVCDPRMLLVAVADSADTPCEYASIRPIRPRLARQIA